ncbi:MAG: response regulator [Chloroflexota bacterium]|nr:response regulator [Chloroflexota bacterium]
MTPETLRILIAEDDYLVSIVVRGLLESMGHDVLGEAADGEEAVKMTCALLPDVVLMDLSMPNMDGVEATRLIHERCPTPVVMLTAYDSEQLVRLAGEVGVGAYLVKPPNRSEVERAIIIARARFGDMMELRRLNTELRDRNEELDAFSHVVAHDLQNPLGLIMGFAGVIQSYGDRLGKEERDKCLRSIVKNVTKMSNIVDELLLLGQVRKISINPQPLEMADIVREAQNRMAAMIRERQAEITTPPMWLQALGYAPWIEEVWVNYLSNALKYGGNPPKIELGATQEQGMIRFWVRDNGAGIVSEQRARLFTPFERLDQIHMQGYGLGLSIVRLIVEKLGGTVGVESTVGEGSTFSFTLPVWAGEEPAKR